MTPAEIDRLYRIRASLPPAQRAEIERLHAAMTGTGPATDPTKATATGSWGPEDLDPVEAAATPITPDPVAGPVRQRSRADWATDAATAGGLYSPSENVESMDVTDAPPPRRPQSPARAGIEQQRQLMEEDRRRFEEYDARVAARARQAAAAGTSRPDATMYPGPEVRDLDSAGRDWSRWKPGMPLPPVSGGGMRPGDDSERGPGVQRVPGPRLPNGQEPVPGEMMYDPKEIANYTTRPMLTPSGQYAPSQKDKDYDARGMKPVYNRDGSVSYSTGFYDKDATGIGTSGRAGVRHDLEDKGWERTEVDGPTGKQMVYRPGETAQAKYDAQKEARSNRRVRNAAGLSASQAAGMSREELQLAAEDARDAKGRDREAAWRSQMMLAGGQPTGGPRGTKAATNALMSMPQDWRNAVLAKSLRPDLDGTTPLTVDANSAKNAMRLLNAEMIGQGSQGEMREKMIQQQTREKAADMADKEFQKLTGWGKKYITPQEADRLRRRVEARFPGHGDVVDGLPVSDDEPSSPSGGGGTGSPWPSGQGAPPQTGPGRLPVAPGATPYRTGA